MLHNNAIVVHFDFEFTELRSPKLDGHRCNEVFGIGSTKLFY